MPLPHDRLAAVGSDGDDLHRHARLPLDELHVALERGGELVVGAAVAQTAKDMSRIIPSVKVVND